MYVRRATLRVDKCFAYHTLTCKTCARSLIFFKYDGMPQQVCGQRRGRTTPFFIILAVVEEAPFRQQRNTSSLIQCDRYFKPDVSRTWAPFLLQVGWQVSIHTSHIIMLVDDISVLVARVVDTYDYLHSKLGLFLSLIHI